MKYTINDNIEYIDIEGEIYLKGGGTSPVTMTSTLNRLLRLLIENNNVALSRDTLLSQVWEDHGKIASGNNLNNTISILRKIFASLGENDIIVTLPRHGFMFAAHRLVKNELLDETLSQMPLAIVDEPATYMMRQHIKRGKRFLATLAILIGVIFVAAWGWNCSRIVPLNTVDLGTLGQCKVKFISSWHNLNSERVDLAHLKQMLSAPNRTYCTEPAVLFYYDSQSLVPGGVGGMRNSYFYYCPQSKNAMDNKQCENIHESWEK